MMASTEGLHHIFRGWRWSPDALPLLPAGQVALLVWLVLALLVFGQSDSRIASLQNRMGPTGIQLDILIPKVAESGAERTAESGAERSPCRWWGMAAHFSAN